MPVTTEPSPRPALDRGRLSAAPGLRIEVLDEAPSTNLAVADLARSGEDSWAVVVTEHQTAGRGRLDRTWHTPARSALTFSVLVRLGVPDAEWPWLPLVAGRAVARTLNDAGFAAGMKWPNDVLIDELKVAGILVERVETPTGPVGVVGIGVNVSTTWAELPVPTATSLELKGATPDRTDLLLALLGALRADVEQWHTDGVEGLRSAYVDACVTLGQEVRVDLPAGAPLTGVACGIDSGGRLLVRTRVGDQAVGAGDVLHVRTR